MLTFFNKRLHNKKGFTLIELIVVIAIIGILAAIAIPRLGGFRTSAQTAQEEANERVIESAVQMYIAENGAPSGSTTENLTSYFESGVTTLAVTTDVTSTGEFDLTTVTIYEDGSWD